ncbi:MAG: DnaJ domain-containing protein [Sneathiella sp.]
MLAYFIIGLALLIGLIIGANALSQADPKAILKGLRISGAIILGLLAAFFTFTGRFQFAPPLALAALFLMRNKPFFRGSPPSSGQQSDVKTDWFHATLDHDSGEMDALILQGDYEGRQLSDLTLHQLQDLQNRISDDEKSASILFTFIERQYPDHKNDPDGDYYKDTSTENKSNGMSIEEALEILELEAGADNEQIKAAHKRLMKKFHPDHDGSAYMAAKINQAKDILINN